SHALMLALLGDAERHGAVLALNAPVTAITVGSAGLQVEVGGADPLQLLARTVVNCAGHGAPILAAHTAGLDPAARPRQFFAKGSYFSLSGRMTFL
ncbi:MAG TPA: FAD-dependent oxidoreductase, partial [Pseudomonas sp.]|nr:FAD-dependent oxidoreductase [Pseudomonas sp.]